MELISKEKLLNKLQDEIDFFYEEDERVHQALEIIKSVIEELPIIESRPKGEWIQRRIIAKDRSFDMVVCSNCQTEFSWDAETGVSMDNYKTCPNCRADMRGEE